jgi:ribosome maturation factor RimP
MAQTSAYRHLETTIRTAFDDGRCGEFFLVDLEVSPNRHITAYIDGDEGVSLEACTRISRVLESILDQEPTLGGIYELEVSSPGVSRPLKFPRQYIKHTGRTLKVELQDGSKVEGRLVNTSPDGISLEIKPADRKAKTENKDILYSDIKEAFVTVSWK